MKLSHQYGKKTVSRLTYQDLLDMEKKGNISIVRKPQPPQSQNKPQKQDVNLGIVEGTEKQRKGRGKAEFSLQTYCIRWLDTFYPHLKETKRRFHVANQGWKGGERTGKLLKAMGKTAGIPDLFILVKTETFSGLIIDFKTPGEHLSPEQSLFFKSMTEEGFNCHTVETPEQFETVISAYLGKSKLFRQ